MKYQDIKITIIMIINKPAFQSKVDQLQIGYTHQVHIKVIGSSTRTDDFDI